MTPRSLTHLTEQIAIYLNSSPPETWEEGYGIGTDRFLEAKPSLDPIVAMERGESGLFIVPVVMNYSRSESMGRRQIISLSNQPLVAITMTIPFTEKDLRGVDVSSWEEVKKVLGLRERIDRYVLGKNWGWNITDIEADPPQEVQLKNRWFVSMTEITFDYQSC
jgi:hypothetical protein